MISTYVNLSVQSCTKYLWLLISRWTFSLVCVCACLCVCVCMSVCVRVCMLLCLQYGVKWSSNRSMYICKYRSTVFVLKNTRYPLIAGRGGQHIFFKSSGEGKLKIFSGPGEGKRFFFGSSQSPPLYQLLNIQQSLSSSSELAKICSCRLLFSNLGHQINLS